MKQLILFTGLYFLSLAAFSFSKIVKEESFHISTIKNITTNSSGGNYTISKYSGDSILVRVSLECKDFEAYNNFMMKYVVSLTNTSGSLTMRTDKIPTTAGTLTYEIYLPSDVQMEINSEKSNVSIKDIKLNLKLTVIEGVLFTDNISGILNVASEKMDMDINGTNLTASIDTKNSKVRYSGKGGTLTLKNSAGKNKIVIIENMGLNIQSISGDIDLQLPKIADCNLQVSSMKKPIVMNLEDILLKGTLTPNAIKVIVGKGGKEQIINSQTGDIFICNTSMLK